MLELESKNLNADTVKSQISRVGLIIIRNCKFDKTSYRDLCHSLGSPLKTERHIINKERTLQLLSPDALFSNDYVGWHNDWSYGRGSYYGTALFNYKGGCLADTYFIDMSRLPETFYDRYLDMWGEYLPPIDFQDSCFTEKQISLLKKQKTRRPFVFSHPKTGERLLYCSPETLVDKSINLTDILDHSEKHAYRHRWRDGDFLIWDNLKMMHRRDAFLGDRQMWRVQFAI